MLTGQCGCMEELKNSSEATTGTASEAFAGWLHCQDAPVELPLAGHIVSLHSTLLIVSCVIYVDQLRWLATESGGSAR